MNTNPFTPILPMHRAGCPGGATSYGEPWIDPADGAQRRHVTCGACGVHSETITTGGGAGHSIRAVRVYTANGHATRQPTKEMIT